jgi:hypothetical protein
MFAAIRRYHTDPDLIEEIAWKVNEGFVPSSAICQGSWCISP